MEKYINNLDLAISDFRKARYCYRHNIEFMSDQEYDNLEMYLKETCPDLDMLHQIYEEDAPLSKEVLLELGITSEFIQPVEKFSLKTVQGNYLANLDNLSIFPCKTTDELLGCIKANGAGTYVASPKIDGIFISRIYERTVGNKFTLSCIKTRGSVSNAIDVTHNLLTAFPKEIELECDEEAIKFNCEAIFKKAEVQATGYKNQRSAALAAISSTVNTKLDLVESIDFIHHGCTIYANKAEQFKVMEKLDLMIPPYNLVIISEEDTDEDIASRLQEISNSMAEWSEEREIGIDGVVYHKESEDVAIKTAASKQYNSNVFADKIDFWASEKYTGVVHSIEAEQQNYSISYRIVLEPLYTKNDVRLTNLTNINLKTLVELDLKPGDKVKVLYLNNTTPKFGGKIFA